MLPGVMRSHAGAGTSRGVVLAAYLSESRWLSAAVRALTRAATQNFCGQYLVRFSRPRETSCIAASVDGCSTNTACLQHMQLGRFARSVGQHVRERSGGLQSNYKAAKTGVSALELSCGIRKTGPLPGPQLNCPHGLCSAAAITRSWFWTEPSILLQLPCVFIHLKPARSRTKFEHCRNQQDGRRLGSPGKSL